MKDQSEFTDKRSGAKSTPFFLTRGQIWRPWQAGFGPQATIWEPQSVNVRYNTQALETAKMWKLFEAIEFTTINTRTTWDHSWVISELRP